MGIPGFTAEHSTYTTSRRFRSAHRSLGNGTRDGNVFMQKPNSQNSPGGSCYGRVSGVLISGTYDSLGRCCTYPPNGFPYCVDCDDVNSKCYDRQSRLSGTLTRGNFQTGIFAQAKLR
jgi:hypothetical protein